MVKNSQLEARVTTVEHVIHHSVRIGPAEQTHKYRPPIKCQNLTVTTVKSRIIRPPKPKESYEQKSLEIMAGSRKLTILAGRRNV